MLTFKYYTHIIKQMKNRPVRAVSVDAAGRLAIDGCT